MGVTSKWGDLLCLFENKVIRRNKVFGFEVDVVGRMLRNLFRKTISHIQPNKIALVKSVLDTEVVGLI